MRTSVGGTARSGAWAVVAAGIGVLLAACGGTDPGPRPADAAPTDPPTVGANRPAATATPPAGRMDRWERHIAARLDRRLRDDGLRLDHLSCPRWRAHASATVTCDAYLHGVRAEVVVVVRPDGDGMDYDARIVGGVVATRALERQVLDAGYRRVDCGEVAAYPADVGLEVLCSCRDATGGPALVVARVTDWGGSVEIAER